MALARLATWRKAAFVAAACALLSGCSGRESGAPSRPPPAVTVAVPTQREVVDYDRYTGRFSAVDSVEVRARVDGYLEAVHFTDGQHVKRGTLLFTIDRRPYRARLDQAKAGLERARSRLAYSERELSRAEKLRRSNSMSEEEYDQRRQQRDLAAADVDTAKAVLRDAALDYEFTEIRAPVAGVVGHRLVSPGNLIHGGADATVLTTIVSTDPIYFYFTVSEAAYLKYRRRGVLAVAGGKGQQVALALDGEQGYPHRGRLDFIDNQVDRDSGTMLLRAVFDNPDSRFTPGLFARIRVAASAPHEALLVPQAAIASDQGHRYVLTVDADNRVHYRQVEPGGVKGDLQEIESGLKPDDRVIVDGLQRARPGGLVTPKAAE